MAVKAANLVLQEIKNKRNAQINVSNIFNKTQVPETFTDMLNFINSDNFFTEPAFLEKIFL